MTTSNGRGHSGTNINSLATILASQSRDERVKFLSALTLEELAHLKYDWDVWARPNQRWETLWADDNKPFSLVLAGRGFGKTRCAVEAVRKAVYEYGYKYIAMVGATATDARQVMVEGEALAVDTLISTPCGWRIMGELKVGDYVFGDDGAPAKISWVSDVAINRPCYKVLFSDGETIVADENHKWFTHTCSAKQYRNREKYPNNTIFPSVVTTKEALETLTRSDKNGKRSNHSIQIAKPVQYQEKELPIHPYVLGAWLGDGRVRSCDFTTGDEKIVETIRGFGYTVTKHKSKYDYRICGLDPILKSMNLLNNKHIPEVYLQGSIEQRTWLLRGLMDTDGYVSPRGQCEFDNNNITLIENFRELIRSFGITVGATSSKKFHTKFTEAPPMYRITFVPNFNVCNLERKSSRLRKTFDGKNQFRKIRDITPCESVPVKCIAVENETHLYLAGKSFIVTHNSGILNCLPDHQRPVFHPGTNELDFPNGARGFVYSADSPERLRGKQSDFFWADELCAWERMRDSFDQIMFGCRLGSPRGIITTTPKPSILLNEILKDPLFNIITGSTYDNQANLAPSFLQQIVKKYEGTRLGQQELYGIVLGEINGALWNASMFKYDDRSTSELKAAMRQIIVCIDPAVTAKKTSDETGIVVVGVDSDGMYFVLADSSGKYSPKGWADEVERLYDYWDANMVIAEVNNGGDLVGANLPPRLPFKAVHASRGKVIRAEPVVSYYEQGKVFHRRNLEKVETEMCEWIPSGALSPGRVDSVAWGWEYLFGKDSRSTGLIAKRLYD